MSRYSELVLADTPSLYWRLGESAGPTATDLSGNTRNGTYVGAPTFSATGLLNHDTATSVDFNGSTQYVTSTYNPFTAGSTRTFEGWSNRDTFAGNHCVWGSSLGGMALQLPPTNPAGVVLYTDVALAPKDLAGLNYFSQRTVHWVVVINDTTHVAECFLDGTSNGSFSSVTAWKAVAQSLWVGTFEGSTQDFDGRIQDFAVYELGLTAAQALQHYRVGREERSGNALRGGL